MCMDRIVLKVSIKFRILYQHTTLRLWVFFFLVLCGLDGWEGGTDVCRQLLISGKELGVDRSYWWSKHLVLL